jgi:organic radical activating enzyme
MPIPDKIIIKQLDLELNGGCNYTCSMCPQADGREKDFLKKLPFTVMTKILDDAMAYGLESVSLHGSGEPTLNADMPEFVKAVKARGVKCMSFTNGSKLTEELSLRLIQSGIDVLRVSAIGYDRPSYSKWMSQDVFEEVRENVKRFVKINKEQNGQSQIHLYHLIIDPERADEEIATYQQNWIEYTGALAEIWMMHNWSGTYDSPYDRSDSAISKQKRSCGRPFSPLLQIRAGGLDGHRAAAVACCMVLGRDSEAVLGHLDESSIKEVIESEAYSKLRQAHTEEKFDDIPYCKDCDQLYELPESLVWSNIPGREYGQSKIVSGMDHRSFSKAQ